MQIVRIQRKEPCGNKALSSEDWYTGLTFTTLFWFCYLEGMMLGAIASMIGLICGKCNILQRPILWIPNPLRWLMLRKQK